MTTRTTTDVTLATTSSAPAEPADMPADVTVSTRKVPAVEPTADPERGRDGEHHQRERRPAPGRARSASLMSSTPTAAGSSAGSSPAHAHHPGPRLLRMALATPRAVLD